MFIKYEIKQTAKGEPLISIQYGTDELDVGREILMSTAEFASVLKSQADKDKFTALLPSESDMVFSVLNHASKGTIAGAFFVGFSPENIQFCQTIHASIAEVIDAIADSTKVLMQTSSAVFQPIVAKTLFEQRTLLSKSSIGSDSVIDPLSADSLRTPTKLVVDTTFVDPASSGGVKSKIEKFSTTGTPTNGSQQFDPDSLVAAGGNPLGVATSPTRTAPGRIDSSRTFFLSPEKESGKSGIPEPRTDLFLGGTGIVASGRDILMRPKIERGPAYPPRNKPTVVKQRAEDLSVDEDPEKTSLLTSTGQKWTRGGGMTATTRDESEEKPGCCGGLLAKLCCCFFPSRKGYEIISDEATGSSKKHPVGLEIKTNPVVDGAIPTSDLPKASSGAASIPTNLAAAASTAKIEPSSTDGTAQPDSSLSGTGYSVL